ncbi:unnamed protein product [Aphis gossypii]|uniref:Endonuclease-reverse transcriptase n=1 Tax=Aphis gossypii TaxID=80765 RepID=A0A9P0J156_APHGO|nr:unnamed protein product [Aphis gossypii]
MNLLHYQDEMDTRILMGNRCYFGLGSMFSSKILSTKLKIQLYITLIRPVVLYGSETWTLRKVEETRLAVFERKILRRIYGPCIDSDTGEWRIRHNDELKNLFQKPDIISEINRRRLMWAGHAWRKEGSFIKAVIKENPTWKRPLGRPRLRWEDRIKKEVKAVEPNTQWREAAEDRERWRQICLQGWS